MESTEKQPVTSPRDELLALASKRYPDRDLSGQNGQNGQTGQDGLAQAVLDMLKENEATIADNNSKNEVLVNLFLKDPASLDLFTRWSETGDLGAALVDVFGDDLSDLSTEEGRAKYSENLGNWRARKEENDRINAEREANIQKSLEDLEAWGNEKGLSTEQKVAVFLRLVEIAANGINNIYTREDYDMVLKETNYDADIKAAREEGQVAGRNERIEAARRSRSTSAAMPPSMPGGQGMRTSERTPEAEEDNPFAGIR